MCTILPRKHLCFVICFVKGYWFKLKFYGIYTTTENLTSCIIKLSVLAITLFVSIACALVSQDLEIFSANSFYITVFLQSVNTVYDIGTFLAKNETQASKYLKIRIVCVIATQLVILLASFAYIIFHIMFLEYLIILIVVIIFTSTPVWLLIWEVFVHMN